MNSEKTEPQFEYASFNRRMISGTIDALILAIILTPITSFLDWLLYGSKGFAGVIREFFLNNENSVSSEDLWNFLNDNHIILKYAVVQLLLIVMIGLFFIFFWMHNGQTPGKMITKCRIVDANSGSKPSKKQLVARLFSYALSTITLCLGFIMVSLTKRRQGLHDIIAKTIVILDRRSK